MNPSENPSRKPINYGRDGEGHVDLGGAKYGTMKKLIDGNIPKDKEVSVYDLSGELREDNEEDNESESLELSAVEIKAITDELRSQFIVVEGAIKNAKYPGLNAETMEKLKGEVEVIKQMVLKNSQITEEV